MFVGKKAVENISLVWTSALPVKMKFSEVEVVDEVDIVEVRGFRLTPREGKKALKGERKKETEMKGWGTGTRQKEAGNVAVGKTSK
ncbi:hypothetical protein L1887_18061 [Cichorium endivia]|nr:hypothetical protein L1887_18061 [Cichorium endivia]